jgi:hypothetical protein
MNAPIAFLRRQFTELFIREKWHVGIVRSPIGAFLTFAQRPPVEWFPQPPRTSFWADPFVMASGGKLAILFEDFDQVSSTGQIAEVTSVDGGRTFSAPQRISGGVFDLPIHKSYPYLFKHGGEIFCIPEAWATNEVSLYHALDFPKRWEKVRTLLCGVRAVDPTIIHFDSRWWLFYTDRGQDTNVHLFLSYAADLAGPWTSHPENPIKSDVRGSRPGGTPFIHEGALYRPAQDSTRTYGGGLAIHRVLKINEKEYEEQEVCRLGPGEQGPFLEGFHTLAGAEDLCVVDGKCFVFVPEIFLPVLKEKFRSFLRLVSS